MSASNIEIRSNEVVFLEPGPSQKTAFYICLLIGVLLFPIGFLLMLAEPGSAAGFFLAGFGLPPLSAAFHIKFAEKKPAAFLFNNFREVFTVTEKNGASASIGYGDLEDVRVRKQAQSSGDGPTTYAYVVYMQKKDGAFWDLYQSAKEKESSEMLEKLKKVIRLESKTSVPPQKLPDFIRYSSDSGKSTFQWKDRFAIVSRLTAFCVLTGIGIILYGAVRNVVKSETGYFGASIVLLFFIFLGCYLALKSLGAFHVVEISEKRLKYGRGRKNPEQWKTVHEISLVNIKKTQFSCTFDKNITNHFVYALDEDAWKAFEKFKTGDVDFGNIFPVLKKMRQAFSVPLYGFLTTDALIFEQHLDEVLRKHGGSVL